MARIVIVPDEGEGARSLLEPIVLAAVVQSKAKSFSALEATANECAAFDLENYGVISD